MGKLHVCNRPDWPIVLDGRVRSGVTHLSMDSNELLGVTFRPRRQLHISQSSTILHATYRGADIRSIQQSGSRNITSLCPPVKEFKETIFYAFTGLGW